MSNDPSATDMGFGKVLEAAEGLALLPDLARVDAWASSVLGVWAEAPDPASIDQDFISWLAEVDHPQAGLVVAALSRLIEVDEAVLRAAVDHLTDPPKWVGLSASADPLRAWQVIEGEVRSIGIGFSLSDGSEHSLLADIVDAQLHSLIVGPGPDELFDGAEDLVDPVPLGIPEAAEAMVAAWQALDAKGGPLPETVYVNGALACRRLAALVDADLWPLLRPTIERQPATAAEPPAGDQLGDPERAELNGWALSVLDGAGFGAGTDGSETLRDPLEYERFDDYPEAEREAFSALEWADWLGVVIGLSRLDDRVSIDPGVLIDLINRCPEVTSTIPKRDRTYYEWVFSMVLPLWREAGVIDDLGIMSPDGAAQLVGAVRTAWGQR